MTAVEPQQLLPIGKVAGQIDDQQELEQFGGLEVDEAQKREAEPLLRPKARGINPKEERRAQQEQPAEKPRVAILAQEAQVARPDGHGESHGRAQGDPRYLPR